MRGAKTATLGLTSVAGASSEEELRAALAAGALSLARQKPAGEFLDAGVLEIRDGLVCVVGDELVPRAIDGHPVGGEDRAL